MFPCKFFARGGCKNGITCNFIHEEKPITWNRFENRASALPDFERLHLNPAAAISPNARGKSTQVCKFFSQGLCIRGDMCWFEHPQQPGLSQQVRPETLSQHSQPAQQDSINPPRPLDSRAEIPCRYFSRPGGCQKDSCPYLHVLEGHEGDKGNSQYVEVNESEDQEPDDDFRREIAGASVQFQNFGQVVKLTFPSDFSLANITGLAPGITPEAVVDIIRGLGLNPSVDSIRVSADTDASKMKALVKAADPLFAKELSARLKDRTSTLSAAPVPIDARQPNCRKVHISWHKSTRTVWLNFGNGKIADRVAQRFNEGTYRCLGQQVKSSRGKKSRSGRGGSMLNPVAWSLTLSDIPSGATVKDIKNAISSRNDEPRHVEMGPPSYQASDAEVSVDIRLRLEEHGPLQSFYFAPTSMEKRVKATAWFQDEADARSACSLNNRPLDILGQGKLTITLRQSTKIKVSSAIYHALKGAIDCEMNNWKERHLAFHVYSDGAQQFMTLKVEGSDSKDVTIARKKLDEILSGFVLVDEENLLWDSTLLSNGSAYKRLKSIERELQAVIVRDKTQRKLQFYGPSDSFKQAVRQIRDMLKEESSMSYEINLTSDQFSRAMRGAFNNLEHAVGKNVASFDVVSRRIIINGTREQHETALSIMDGRPAHDTASTSDRASPLEGDCPICCDEAETPIQTSCRHIYCLACFGSLCTSDIPTRDDEFRVRCQGDEGNCATIFTLQELTNHLPSSVFESVLRSSFEEYIKRHPQGFRYCPSPDCGYVYRSATTSNSELPAYRCPKCCESLCTSCHERHGDYTCAEYKDIASGGYAALERLKKELNIKNCPKCTTPMEKTEGCNHMTCGGCKAHICWVCMAVFETSGPCYAHMNKEHGGHGGVIFDLQDFARW